MRLSRLGLDPDTAEVTIDGQQITAREPIQAVRSFERGAFLRASRRAVETRAAAVSERMLELLPAARAEALTAQATIDLYATDVEVYGRKKQGWPTTTRGSEWAARTWPPGPRPRPRWPLIWAAVSMIPASGHEDRLHRLGTLVKASMTHVTLTPDPPATSYEFVIVFKGISWDRFRVDHANSTRQAARCRKHRSGRLARLVVPAAAVPTYGVTALPSAYADLDTP